MKELQCPNCRSVFVVDKIDYGSIVNQVKNAEFQEELNRRVEEAEIAQDDKSLKIPVLRGECTKHFVMITICLEKNKEQVQDRYVRIYATNEPEVFNFKF